MSILYSLISKDLGVVLSEYTEYSGNFQQITRMILKKIVTLLAPRSRAASIQSLRIRVSEL